MAFSINQTVGVDTVFTSSTDSTGPIPWFHNVTPGNAIVVHVWCRDATQWTAGETVTDIEGNAYIRRGSSFMVDLTGNFLSVMIFVASDITGGDNPEVTFSNSNVQDVIQMLATEVNTPTGVVFDHSAGNVEPTTPQSSGNAGTIVTSYPHDMVIGLFAAPTNGSQSIAIPAGFTSVGGESDNTIHFAASASFADFTVPTTSTPIWTVSPDSTWMGVIVSFSTESGTTTGTTSGSGDAVGATLAIKSAMGTSAGMGQALANGTAAAISIGHTSGRGDLAGIGRYLALARGLSYGLGDARGVGKAVSKATGSAGGIGGAIAFPAGFPVPGYCSVLTDRAKIEILAFVKPVFASWSVMLMSAMAAPTQQQTIFTVTESAFPGYSRRPITHISNPVLDGLGHAVCQADAVMWTNTGLVPVTVVGWGYVRTGSFPPLRSSGLFMPAKVLAPGHSLALIPMLDDTSLC